MSGPSLAAAAFAAATVAATAGMAIRRAAQRVPPVPRRRPTTVLFGRVGRQNRGDDPMDPPKAVVDDLFWLRDDKRAHPEVLEHLHRENAFTERATRHLGTLKQQVYDEFLGRMQETTVGYPYPHGDTHLYYTRSVKGKSYDYVARVSRAVAGAEASAIEAALSKTEDVVVPDGEEMLLDINALADGHKFCDCGDWEPSPSHKLLAYTVDFDGNETYDLVVKDLETGELRGDKLTSTYGTVVWGADDTEMFYVTLDKAHRPWKVWRHVLGTPQSADTCLLTEEDEAFYLRLRKSDDERFLVATARSKVSAQVWLMPLARDAAATTASAAAGAGAGGGGGGGGGADGRAFTSVQDRVEDMIYSAEPSGDRLFITTNKGDSVNFKLMTAPMSAPGADNWIDVLPHRATVKIDGIDCFETFLAVYGREGGFPRIWVLLRDDALAGGSAVPSLRLIPARDPVYVMGGASNHNHTATVLRYSYSSPTTPPSVCEYDVRSATFAQLKQRNVPGYDSSKYRCVRGTAAAEDGTAVPITILYRPDAHGMTLAQADAAAAAAEASASGLPSVLPSAAPLLLYGYGSYGACVDPRFSQTVVSLVDRGIVYAIAHIRGGGEMGRAWYEKEGKLLTKRNTFTDFIACGDALVESGWAAKGRLAAMGASAGGLLMGAVVNMRPELFSTVVAKVPFVDVMVTMCDASIPLTVTEWKEWGNPNSAKYYDYMRSYSPMENIRSVRYPRILATAGLNDSRVAFWEPAKWVARLRDATLADPEGILLKVDMSSGHFSLSDRYQWMKEYSLEYAFLIDSLVGRSSGAGAAGPDVGSKL